MHCTNGSQIFIYYIIVKTIQSIKTKYENGKYSILKLHRSGAGGVRVALVLTHHLDTILQTIFQRIEGDTRQLSIIALGGYGRKELCFSSDTDIMFLIADEQQHLTALAIQNFLHMLLDIGLDVGHSTRSISECLSLSEEDFNSRMSLIEARFVCGDNSLYRELIASIENKIKEDNHKAFVRQMSELQHARHQKYGNSSKLLEPNIKNSAGGLRDIHTAFWLMRGTDTIHIPKKLGTAETAIIHMLKSAAIRNQFTPSFLKEALRAFDTLLRIRNEMHIQSKALHDTLEFNLQPCIASNLRYRSHLKRTKVELFMQDYYIASRTVALLCSRIINWASDRWSAEALELKTTKLYGPFVLRKRRIYLSKRGISISNELLLRALMLRNEHHAEFSFQLEDAIHRRLHFIRPLNNQIETDLFRLLLHQPNGVGNSLRKMNELGLLERWIPEWKPMVSFFQHNQYHFYTADEHTLIALFNAETLEQSSSSFGVVFRSLPRRDKLYLGCLLHDIAKPLHIGNHEIKGVLIAKRVLQRLRYGDVVEDVAFLVRHHLLMEQIAFRRNLNDPQTIAEFAHTFERIEQLDYLYILTYADLSAVNRNVLTEWKELLLRDLYRKTRAVLEEDMTSEQIHERTAQEVEQKWTDVMRYLIPEFPPEEVEEHIALFSDTAYLSTFKSEEIAAHLQIIRSHENGRTLFQQYDTYTEITIIAQDAPGVLSKICGVLTANDANILDAQIFTRRDGIVIDKFRVIEFVSHAVLSEETRDRISQDLKEVIAGRTAVANLIARHQARWKRRTQQVNPNTRCDVKFKDHPHFTIIDIYAPDTLGFLYSITDAISRLGLNITFAKIATRVDGIVDSFYLLNSDGKKLDDAVQKDAIKQEILATIKKFQNHNSATINN
jgi:[protein-PII] uridylyltransferase